MLAQSADAAFQFHIPIHNHGQGSAAIRRIWDHPKFSVINPVVDRTVVAASVAGWFSVALNRDLPEQ
jgi:hypothetical protein